ncbi:MAG: hypothetical protein K2Q25_10910 [Mycobacteriaceae bacterium]|nr:hypothetical protein [Mycobacteriaceae bacterium]
MTASLAIFGEIVVVAGGVAIAATQGGLLTAQHKKMTDDAYIDIAAAGSAALGLCATMTSITGPQVTMASLGYLYAALAAIEALALFNGFGPPERGQDFKQGHTKFYDEIYGILEEAYPSHWSGEARDEYLDCLEKQKGLVDDMAHADEQMANHLNHQANEVDKGRDGFAAIQLSTTGIIVVATAMAAVAASAWANSWIPGMTAAAESLTSALVFYAEWGALVVLTAGLGLMSSLLGISGQVLKPHFKNKEDQFYSPTRSAAKQIAPTVGVVPDPVVPDDGGTVDPVFPDLPDAPDEPTSDDSTADAGDDTQHSRIPIGFFTRDPIFTGDRLNAASAEAAAVHKQMSALSKEAAPYMNMANQAEQQAQQISSSIQQMASQANQGQEAAKDATLADDTKEDPEAKDKDKADEGAEGADGATPDDKMTLAGAAPDEAAGPAGAPPADRITLAGATSEDQATPGGAALAQAVLAASMNSAAAAAGSGAAPAAAVPFGVAGPSSSEQSDDLALAQRMGF